MASWERIADIDEISPGERKSVIVDELPALLLRVGDNYFCIEDVCSHDGQPLTDGVVSNGEIECPRHGARFDLATGAVRCMPATEPIRSFPVDIREDGVYADAELQ